MTKWSDTTGSHARQTQWLRLLLVIGLVLAAVLPSAVSAQPKRSGAAAVYVRTVHIDPLLLASGADSSVLRAAAAKLLRNASLLVTGAAGDTPAIDLALTVMTRESTGAPGVVGFVTVEVGRNRLEAGNAARLVWSGSRSLRTYPTVQALAAALPDQLLQLVQAYIAGSDAET